MALANRMVVTPACLADAPAGVMGAGTWPARLQVWPPSLVVTTSEQVPDVQDAVPSTQPRWADSQVSELAFRLGTAAAWAETGVSAVRAAVMATAAAALQTEMRAVTFMSSGTAAAAIWLEMRRELRSER